MVLSGSAEPESVGVETERETHVTMSWIVTNCHEIMSHRDNAAVSVIKSVLTTVTRAMQSVLMRSALSAFNRSLLEITIVMKVKLRGDDSPWASRDVILSVRRATWKQSWCNLWKIELLFGLWRWRAEISKQPSSASTHQPVSPTSQCLSAFPTNTKTILKGTNRKVYAVYIK